MKSKQYTIKTQNGILAKLYEGRAVSLKKWNEQRWIIGGR